MTTPGADRAAAFADCEAESFLHRYRSDEFDFEGAVVARHYHFDALGKLDLAGDVGGTEVELRLISAEERRVASAFFFLQDVNLALEVRMRLDASRLREDLSALDVFFAYAARSTPTLSPASASSRILRNISRLVATVF